MFPKNKPTLYIGLALLLVVSVFVSPLASNLKKPPNVPPSKNPTNTLVATSSPPSKLTPPPTLTATLPNTPTLTLPVTLTVTISPTATTPVTLTPTPSQGNIAPYPSAPLCPDHTSEHVNNHFHTLWDSARGCHYDHEHGVSPFTPQVAAAFPGFNLLQLLCGNEVSHCNPSSAMENTHKHGGNKWQVDLASPNGRLEVCQQGFEDGTVAVKAYAIQYHNFGRQDIEFEVRQHSSVAMLSFCKDGNPNDVGYMFIGQLQEYGQRITPYQGYLLPYPDNHQPSWSVERGQYFSTECSGTDIPMPPGMSDLGHTIADCRNTGDTFNNNIGVWTSKITGIGSSQPGARPPGSSRFTLLFRPRDSYQRVLSSDLVHPFTWTWVCGNTSYNPTGCRFNNSTTMIHEVAGTIPASWDNLAGWDTDPRVGRVTAEGFVTRYGDRNTSCTVAGGLDCQPIKMVSAFVGFYSSEISVAKVSNPDPSNTPERDIYFCGTAVCSETSPSAVPSGWIGSEN